MAVNLILGEEVESGVCDGTSGFSIRTVYGPRGSGDVRAIAYIKRYSNEPDIDGAEIARVMLTAGEEIVVSWIEGRNILSAGVRKLVDDVCIALPTAIQDYDERFINRMNHCYSIGDIELACDSMSGVIATTDICTIYDNGEKSLPVATLGVTPRGHVVVSMPGIEFCTKRLKYSCLWQFVKQAESKLRAFASGVQV